jgi:hypothetical protein
MHMMGAPANIQMADSAGDRPIASAFFQKCTISHYRSGFNGQNFPKNQLRGAISGASGEGWLFDECMFIANFRVYVYHQPSGFHDPATDNPPRAVMPYVTGVSPPSSVGRLLTLRNCQFRVADADRVGAASGDIRAIDFLNLNTSREIELDGVVIAPQFANAPFDMGSITVRHRNVFHGRTFDTTPWTDAGAQVSI